MNAQNLPQFKKAEKKKSWLKIALTGPSGSGKTYSALAMATGLGKKIALIDTENHSAALYSGDFDFDTLNIDPPFLISKYLEAMEAAILAGYEVLIIDSISHAWAGEGGLLAKKESLDSSGRGNSYTNWASITKEQEVFKSRLVQAEIHLIATMRSKQDYVLQQDSKGKQVPMKVGLAPVQRDGMEYEFTTVFDVSMNHEATVSKDRTNLFDGKMFKIAKNTGELFLKWLSSAVGELGLGDDDLVPAQTYFGTLQGKVLGKVKEDEFKKFLEFFDDRIQKHNPPSSDVLAVMHYARKRLAKAPKETKPAEPESDFAPAPEGTFP